MQTASVNEAQSPHRVLGYRAALGTYLISVLPGSQTFTLHHFDFSFSAFQSAQWQRQCCSSFRFAWLFLVPCGKPTPELLGCSAKLLGSSKLRCSAQLPESRVASTGLALSVEMVMDSLCYRLSAGIQFSSAGNFGVFCPVEIEGIDGGKCCLFG